MNSAFLRYRFDTLTLAKRAFGKSKCKVYNGIIMLEILSCLEVKRVQLELDGAHFQNSSIKIGYKRHIMDGVGIDPEVLASFLVSSVSKKYKPTTNLSMFLLYSYFYRNTILYLKS